MGEHFKIGLVICFIVGSLAQDIIEDGTVTEDTPELLPPDGFPTTTIPDYTTIGEDDCEYEGRWYSPGEEVKTHEPCLRCKCSEGSLVCHLRVCPSVPETVPQGCYHLKKAGECCTEVVCGDSEDNRLSFTRKDTELEKAQEAELTEAAVVRLQDEAALAAVFGTRRRGSHKGVTTPKTAIRRGCVTEGAVFAEGSAMVSPDECSYCFCIKGKQRCVAPKCLLPVEGCRPRYRTFSCCPSYYDCHDARTTTTTTSRTPRDCEVNGVRYAEGAPLVDAAGGACENCYCLNGEVSCTRTSCAPPLEGCKPVMQEGHCCPVKYDCDDGNRRVSVDEFFKDFPVKIATANHRSEMERPRPDWQTNMARKSPGGETIISDSEVKEYQDASEGNNDEVLEAPEKTPTDDEITDQEKSSVKKPLRRNRPRFSSMISRPSREEIANRRKETRYSNRRPTAPRRRPQSQSLSFRFRQRIKLDKDKDDNEESKEPTPTSSTTTAFISTSSTTTAFISTATEPPTSTTSSTTTLLSSEPTTQPLQESTAQQTTSTTLKNDIDTITEFDTAIYEDTDTDTTDFTDTTLAYGPVPGIDDTVITTESPLEISDDTDSQTSTTNRMPILEPLPSVDSSTDIPSVIASTTTSTVSRSNSPSSTTTTTTTTTSSTAFTPSITETTVPLTTTTLSTTIDATTTESEDESLLEISGFNHAGEAILLEDYPESSTWMSLREPPALSVDEQIEVGTGVNVKGNVNDAVAFGPILIFDNRVRRMKTDRQQKDLNGTEEEVVGDELNTVVTDIPEETTMLAKEDIIDDGVTDRELLTDYDDGTQEVTTLFPLSLLVQDTSVKSLIKLPSTTTTSSSTTITTEASSAASGLPEIPADVFDYTDIETNFPSYDITVGTSVLATNQAKPQASGVGQVIPVELKPEHKSPEIESAPEVDERPSFLGTILNILTRTERPRPSRLPPPPPRPPFRPRPRPSGRPEPRPDFVPPRFRFTPPPPTAAERDVVEGLDTDPTASPPAPLIIPTTKPPVFNVPTNQPPIIINRPVSGFNRPSPVINIPVHAGNRPDIIPIRSEIPNRPTFLPKPPIAPQSDNPNGLPSKPVIEGGFQGMRDEEGIQPNFDYSDYDGEPTLPPSLPNLRIIPFVAADALVNQEIGIAGDEFRVPPLLLADKGEDEQESQTPPVTTEASSTTTRRPFLRLPIGDRRPPILPPRRQQVNRPSNGSSTRRPFLPFRRPGERPSRPPFSPKATTTTDSPITNSPEENVGKPKPTSRPSLPFSNRNRPSTRPPFIPPRRPTPTTTNPTTTPTTTTTTSTTTTTTTTTRRPFPTTTTSRPIVSDDIANLLLQDVFGLSDGQNTPPVRFTPARTTSKPIIPVKISTALPEIPSAVRDQLPLATDPVLASGLLKLSGCNIYGRMYNVGDQITELSAICKECRCTPVGVQCLPVC